jgi:hypothetical protein
MMTGYGSTSSFPVDGWRSATPCGPDGGNCVEVNLAARGAAGGIEIVGIRDSKPVTSPVLVFAGTGWRSFLAATIMDDIRV